MASRWLRMLSVAVGVGVGSGVARADPPALPAVAVVGWQVQRDVPEAVAGRLPFDRDSGTLITLVLDVPQQVMLTVDVQKAVATCRDDTGLNLLAKGPDRLEKPGFADPDFSADGHRAKLVFRTLIPPAQAACQLTLKSTFPLSLGRDPKTLQAKGVSLKDKTKFKLGPMEFGVGRPARPPRDQAKMTVRLDTRPSFRGVKSLRFLDGDGKEVTSTQRGSGGGGVGEYRGEYRDYEISKDLTSVTIEAEMFTNLQTLHVPIEVRLDVNAEMTGSE